MNLIDKLHERYAVKQMTGEKIEDKELEQLLTAIRLTPSAYGLQPYTVFVVDDEATKEKIYDTACQQAVVKSCSHLLIFTAFTDISATYVENFLAHTANTRHWEKEWSDNYKSKIDAALNYIGDNLFEWTARQAYIALGFGIAEAAELGIDTTPIEGFSPEKLDELFDFNKQSLGSVVMLAIGKRDEENCFMYGQAKVRKRSEDLFRKLAWKA